MTKTRKPKAVTGEGRDDNITVRKQPDETEAVATAKTLVAASIRHAAAVSTLHEKQFGKLDFMPGIGDYASALRQMGKDVASGELGAVSQMLMAQAVTLDSIFVEASRRMAQNMGEHTKAMEIYARMAMKAQSNSRATLETLVKLHQPREQTVRHIHVNEGAQAVIADQFHHHNHTVGGSRIADSVEQPHATGNALGPAGGTAGEGTALPCQDPLRQGVPVSSGERGEAV